MVAAFCGTGRGGILTTRLSSLGLLRVCLSSSLELLRVWAGVRLAGGGGAALSGTKRCAPAAPARNVP